MRILDIDNKCNWNRPEIKDNIPHGDMPGDKIKIGKEHVDKSEILFRELLKMIPQVAKDNSKLVISVCGGSGVGKSEIASLLSYYFNDMGIESYTLSGDNYPKRIPIYNDAERLRVFRENGVNALVKADLLSDSVVICMKELQESGNDADVELVNQYPWLKCYLKGAIAGLKTYLGTDKEIEFEKITDIIQQFKAGDEKIWLKRMGRTDSELWYEKVDFSSIQVLIIEWTHGNSDNFQGVDIPIFLNSTPEETLAHRRSRNRDGKPDSAFITRVLEVEQEMLENQAHKAKIIISKRGNLLSYDEYRRGVEKNEGSK